MHTLANAATGVAAICYLVNFANASPVVIDQHNVTTSSSHVHHKPTSTVKPAPLVTRRTCSTEDCRWCDQSACFMGCYGNLWYGYCCDSSQMHNSVVVYSADEIDWQEYLATKGSTTGSSPEAEIEYCKSLAAADHAKFYRTEVAASKRDTAEVDDADGPKHCCTPGCGFCSSQRCVKEKGTMGCNRGTFAECCDHKHTKNSIFVESADQIPWESLGDDWLGDAYETPRTLTKRTVAQTKAVEEITRDVSPTMSIGYASITSAVTAQTPDPNDKDSKSDNSGEPAYPIHLRDDMDGENPLRGYCCQDGCIFCWAGHWCFLEFGCNQKDKPQYNTCCTPRAGMVWVPGD